VLHAIFNIFLEMNWTFLLVPFLTGGYIYVSRLFEKKESHKVYCMVDNNRNDGAKAWSKPYPCIRRKMVLQSEARGIL
ncbi:MAG TPA: hypothetical protein VI588_01245, partial [Candidatus Gracilibacteria bacterium]|nr:hypothetical protein [Candidatus Gracilibacteria bacterium]